MASTNTLAIIVFFVSGLAFFSMGLAVALEARRSTTLTLGLGLSYLAAFGILHSAVDWIDMFILIQSLGADVPDSLPIRPIRLLLLAVSAVCLLQFAVKLINTNLRRHYWLSWVPLTLFVGWLFSFVAPHIYWVPPGPLATAPGSCLECHQGESPTYLALSGGWVNSADIWSRYLMYLPGGILGALAMLTMKPYFKARQLVGLDRYATFAAVAFGADAFLAGVIVPPATFFPASAVNYATFYDVVHVAPQVLRAGVAVSVAYFVVRISKVFEIQQRRQLEKAQRERIEAQQRALESQQRAQQQLERWNRELEGKVQQRTREVEHRNRQVAILEERERIARELHDSLGQVLSYMGLKIYEIERLLLENKVEQARLGLRQMAEGVQESCADVRESILALKTSVQNEGGLIQALEEYVVKFGDQAGMKTELLVSGGIALKLPPLAEVQLLRIVQEALTNIRKHAQARHAWVRIEASNGDARIIVEDDGCGFNADGVSQLKGNHFGLHTMQERAEEIGGTFTLNSAAGKGTKVIVEVRNGS